VALPQGYRSRLVAGTASGGTGPKPPPPPPPRGARNEVAAKHSEAF